MPSRPGPPMTIPVVASSGRVIRNAATFPAAAGARRGTGLPPTTPPPLRARPPAGEAVGHSAAVSARAGLVAVAAAPPGAAAARSAVAAARAGSATGAAALPEAALPAAAARSAAAAVPSAPAVAGAVRPRVEVVAATLPRSASEKRPRARRRARRASRGARATGPASRRAASPRWPARSACGSWPSAPGPVPSWLWRWRAGRSPTR